jgi:hypothetical protein
MRVRAELSANLLWEGANVVPRDSWLGLVQSREETADA